MTSLNRYLRCFHFQGVSSGACAATVLLKDGELHVANVGDCRVVLSRKGVADAMTNDHRLSSREDERLRIESSVCSLYNLVLRIIRLSFCLYINLVTAELSLV